MYSLLKPILFRLDPEVSHHLAFSLLKQLSKADWLLPKSVPLSDPIMCFGLQFPNRVGLAAGLDKNGECVPAWQAIGFGFVEVGTVTPRAQMGNPKPRLFRLTEHQAIINRMGFNNRGIDYLVEQLRYIKRLCPVGINIGKNKDTSLERAAEDYLFCFEKAYEMADYITVNISSPNTPGLRTLQQADFLRAILVPLVESRKKLADKFSKNVPILVKIAPDLEEQEISPLVDELVTLQVEGVIATNTTVSRPSYLGAQHQQEGGLSGAPLTALSTKIVRLLHEKAGEALPIVAAGGIMTAQDAKEKFEAGASLVQLYTGLIYRGPSLIREIKAVKPCSVHE